MNSVRAVIVKVFLLVSNLIFTWLFIKELKNRQGYADVESKEPVLPFSQIQGMDENIKDAILDDIKVLVKGESNLRSGLLLNKWPEDLAFYYALSIASEVEKQGQGKVTVLELSAQVLDHSVLDIGKVHGWRLQKTLQYANKKKPCIIFIKDLDRVVRNREQNSGITTQNFALEQMLTGIEGLSGVYIIATVNDIEKVDKALIRAGRLNAIDLDKVGNLDKETHKLPSLNKKFPWAGKSGGLFVFLSHFGRVLDIIIILKPKNVIVKYRVILRSAIKLLNNSSSNVKKSYKKNYYFRVIDYLLLAVTICLDLMGWQVTSWLVEFALYHFQALRSSEGKKLKATLIKHKDLEPTINTFPEDDMNSMVADLNSRGQNKKGFFFRGSPGIGKTFLVKRLASILKKDLLIVSFKELKQSIGNDAASKIKQIGNMIENNQSIIFIDEIDGLLGPSPSIQIAGFNFSLNELSQDGRADSITKLSSYIRYRDGIKIIVAANDLDSCASSHLSCLDIICFHNHNDETHNKDCWGGRGIKALPGEEIMLNQLNFQAKGKVDSWEKKTLEEVKRKFQTKKEAEGEGDPSPAEYIALVRHFIVRAERKELSISEEEFKNFASEYIKQDVGQGASRAI